MRWLWRADSHREFSTVGHKVREALQEFATEAVARYAPPDVEENVARVNKRLGAVIAKFLPVLGEKRAALLMALGDYSEATLAVVQRQEHGGQKEGEVLAWRDARRVVFHAASVMYEFAGRSTTPRLGPGDRRGDGRSAWLGGVQIVFGALLVSAWKGGRP